MTAFRPRARAPPRRFAASTPPRGEVPGTHIRAPAPPRFAFALRVTQMPFTHTDKGPGDLIRSADWNAMGQEIKRLGGDKVDRAGDTLAGPLAVRGELSVGVPDKGASLRVLKKQEDGTAVDHGAVILGTSSEASASLRLGYGGVYSWIQGQGKTTLALNPRGGNVGIGTDAPQDRLEVAGTLRVGSGANPLQIGGGNHTGFVNQGTANAEISNDTADHKTLMILGNSSAGMGRRVSVWDRLEVNGALAVTGGVTVGGTATVTGKLTATGDAAIGGAATVAGKLTTGDAAIGGAATVTGKLTATADAAIGGAATVTGKLTATADAAIGGAATVAGKLTATGDAAIGGAATVGGRLTVSGALTPSAGNAETAGIMFPRDPGKGGGDAAWMRYYARSGESCTLELGTSDNAEDHIALMPSGNVGVGVTAPAEKLEVAGSLRVGSGASPIQIGGGGHTGFVNQSSANAEISNDTSGFKTLMILGNSSAGIGRRVSVWDRLEVNGTLVVTGDVSLSGGLMVPGASENTRVLRGCVNANGSIDSGVGFTVGRGGGWGLYDINFNAGFSGRPSGVVTQVYPNFNDFGLGADTRDNAVIVGINAGKMRVKMGDGGGGASDRNFCFIVVGPR
jgi:predicted acyltransferase (DUF342 family)